MQQISRTRNLDSNLIARQYKLNLVADFMRIKCENPRLKQSEIAKHLGYTIVTVQRYKNDTNMVSPYSIQPNTTNKRTKKKPSNTNFDNNSHREHDLIRPRLNSKDLKRPQSISESPPEVKPDKSESKLKGGGVVEINDQYLDEILDIID